MYEYKIFGTDSSLGSGSHYLSYDLPDVGELLEKISQKGWEPIQIDYNTRQILAKRLKTLND